VLRIRIRNPVPFWPLDPDPGSGIGFFRILDLGPRTSDPGSRISNLYFWELSNKFWGKKFYNSLKTGPNFLLQHFKNKIIFNFAKFVATKKGMTTNLFHPSLLLLFLDLGSGIRDPGCGIIVLYGVREFSAQPQYLVLGAQWRIPTSSFEIFW